MFNKKKKYFQNKLDGVEKMLWDLEFKKFKTLEIREEVRQEYDNQKSKLATIEIQLKDENLKEDDKGTLEDQKVILERDTSRFLEQIKQLDLEVYGSRPTNEYPDGVTGLDQQVEALQELKGMLIQYTKSL